MNRLMTVALLFSLTLLQGCIPLLATGVLSTTTLVVTDRRSTGTQADDEAIEWKAEARVGKRFPEAHVNVVSYNRRVLVTGEAKDSATVSEIVRLVAGVENVVGVVNELKVAATSTLSGRSNDAYLTSKVKARFVDAGKFSLHRVKVLTEAGSVFLLGVVTQMEADAAIDVARTTGGVMRVVNVMDIISDEEARRIDNNIGNSVSSTKLQAQ